MDHLDGIEFTFGDDDLEIIRFPAPDSRTGWEQLLGALLECSPAEARMAYETMFPNGYDPNGTDDAVLHVEDLMLDSTDT